MESTVIGNKKLIFHLYVFDGFENNLYTHLHEICLKNFISYFDSAIFSIAVDDLNDYSKIQLGISFVNRICNGVLPYDIVIIQNNKELREVSTFKQIVIPLIVKGTDECVFFAHNKGCTHYYGHDYSVARWCILMYYYSFYDMNELCENFKNGKAFYGFSLYERTEDLNHCYLARYPFFYAGTFYWMNIKRIKELAGEHILDLFSFVNDKYSAEEFPRFFDYNQLSSHKNIVLRNLKECHNMYSMYSDMWVDFIRLYFDKDCEIIPFMDEVIMEIIRRNS